MKTVMQATILFGGEGTRREDAATVTPRPLLEVGGRPFIEHTLLNLRRFGFNDFVLLAGSQAELVTASYGPGSAFLDELDAGLRILAEPATLETAGRLEFARAYLREQFLLLNGDAIFDFNYLDLCLCQHPGEDNNWQGRVALRPSQMTDRAGGVALQGPHIQSLQEQPNAPVGGLVNSGVYWLKRSVLDTIDAQHRSLEQDVLPRLAAAGLLVGRRYRGYFIDIGTAHELARARDELPGSLRKPAAFLDRDGTLNYDAGYTHKIEEFRWTPGAIEAIRILNDAGFLVFLVTNQSGIARGYYTAREVDTLHDWMQGELAHAGAHIDDIRFCPHHPQGSVAELAIACDCRKPEPGMLKSLIARWQPLLNRSFMLGDADRDITAANRLGLRATKVAPGELLDAVSRRI